MGHEPGLGMVMNTVSGLGWRFSLDYVKIIRLAFREIPRMLRTGAEGS